jgi:hypothetical protein
LGVVAEHRMGIERQVVGVQIDLVAQQAGQPLLAQPDDPAVFAAPEIAVVHQHRVGLPADRRVKQGLACGDAGDESAQLGASFHLQTVWAIIAQTRRLKELIEVGEQRFARQWRAGGGVQRRHRSGSEFIHGSLSLWHANSG